MSNNNSPKFQVHPKNTNGKLLRRFYEPLVLLRVLDPTRGSYRPDLITERGLDDPSKIWRNFLDKLCLLCDSKTGGDTVTAIAVQETLESSCFWVAANSNWRQRAHKQVSWLLRRLIEFYHSRPITTIDTESELAKVCIQFCTPRIKTYIKRLLQRLEKAVRSVKSPLSAQDQLLFGELQEIQTFAEDHFQACQWAYNLREKQAIQILNNRHTMHQSRGIWSDIRHYIGRLGAYIKAVKVLMLATQKFPQRIENALVKVVELRGPTDRPDRHHLDDLNGLIRRMLPIDEEDMANELSEALSEVGSLTNIQDKFRDEYTEMKPRPHAELLILEHFHENDFEFVGRDKYIGCSKPSCYCCDKYMQIHKGDFVRRSCHGNLWTNWAPPIPLPMFQRKAQKGTRPQDHHTFKMLQDMIPDIRQALKEQILSRRPRRKKLPDSTTGLSSVAGAARMLETMQADLPQNPYLPLAQALGTVSDTLTGTSETSGGVYGSKDAEFVERESIESHASQSLTDDIDMNCSSVVASRGHSPHVCTDPNESTSSGDEDGVLCFTGRSTS